mmetsp:Transcript_29693/g.43829  ORF Transcript_29693/g.43829 Transcript_29693/m.43829 type:complete len:80 (-) Transcript_29693:1681-1920(-)|eukprot:3547168-Ditylum_brightwellii.AAC.1
MESKGKGPNTEILSEMQTTTDRGIMLMNALKNVLQRNITKLSLQGCLEEKTESSFVSLPIVGVIQHNHYSAPCHVHISL